MLDVMAVLTVGETCCVTRQQFAACMLLVALTLQALASAGARCCHERDKATRIMP
jgi:hypothetical protein